MSDYEYLLGLLRTVIALAELDEEHDVTDYHIRRALLQILREM